MNGCSVRSWWTNFREMAAGFDARTASDDELFTAAVVLTKLESLVAGVKGRVLAELDARGSCDREKGSPTGAWLADAAGIPKRVARRQVKVARKLRALPLVDEAVLDGRITMHHAEVLASACNRRVADVVAEAQDTLLGLVEGATFEQWQAEVRDLVNAIDQDGGHDPGDDEAENRLHVDRTIDDITIVNGQFVGADAAVIRQATDTVADELFRRYKADHDLCPDLAVPERPELLAEAWVEMARRALAVDLHSTKAPRPDVTVIVRAGEPDDTTGPAVTEAGKQTVRLQDGTLRTLLCDPDLYPVIVDSLGEPLDLGRRARLASPGQRRALTDPRRLLRLPRLRPPHIVVRRPPCRPFRARWPHRSHQFGDVVPPPSRRQSPAWLGDARHR